MKLSEKLLRSMADRALKMLHYGASPTGWMLDLAHALDTYGYGDKLERITVRELRLWGNDLPDDWQDDDVVIVSKVTGFTR